MFRVAAALCSASITLWAKTAHTRTAQKEVFGWVRQAHWNALHLRLIYFGREHCPAPRHDPTACRICAWAAVPPYDRRALCQLRSRPPTRIAPVLLTPIR